MKINSKHLFLIVFFGNFSLSAAAGDLLSKATSDDGLSIHSESLLINAVDNIRNSNTDKAIKSLRQLIKINPDFKAAQLMYADLMLSRSQVITDFGNIPNASFERISALRDEVQARWLNHKTPVDKNKIPASLVQLANMQEHVIVVDSSRSRLFLFKNQRGVPRLVKDFYVDYWQKWNG